ncbi:hypothetical protein SY27_08605 [Flavobacterium sp. 316]|uniref:hypothetical protein n=1 Tax=Flavobacterium sp. 316 TaxID=1603293 RepID=UPI0005DD1CC2|nr:hypothetical protein [Flavobacterium sp. 316]KIX21730.1 hypothetical protein SY27_08605 [Flavobacterium sp. 316]
MKKSILSLRGVQQISKEEQKNVFGGERITCNTPSNVDCSTNPGLPERCRINTPSGCKLSVCCLLVASNWQ